MDFSRKRIALAADESQMAELINWVEFNHDLLIKHELYTTPTVAQALTPVLKMKLNLFQHSNGNGNANTKATPSTATDKSLDLLVLFLDPAITPNDEIMPLLEVATSYRVPIAGNRSAANFMFPAHLMPQDDH